MNFAFHPEAEEEFNEAIELPKAWAVVVDEIRRSLVRRFPYGVLYSEEQDRIFVVAVMNLHRSPDYWKHRK